MDDRVKQKIQEVNTILEQLTQRIRQGLDTAERSYFDIHAKMAAIRALSKVQGEEKLKGVSGFFVKRLDDIADNIKKGSVATLKANKDRLENLKDVAYASLGDSPQAKSVYRQYEILAKK